MRMLTPVLFLACISLVLAAPLSAQIAEEYPVWDRYDSSFHAGALGIHVPVIAGRILHLDHNHLYGTSVAKMKTQYNDTNDIKGEIYRRAGSEGVLISANPIRAMQVVFSSRVSENYLQPGRGFHLADFLWESGVYKTEFFTSDSIVRFGEISDSPTPFRVLAQPRYLNPSLEVGFVSTYTESGLGDSSRFVRLLFYLNISQNDANEFGVETSDTIAYTVLNRRYFDPGDTLCTCKFSERFDTVYFTYGEYFNAVENTTGSYRPVSTMLHVDSLSSVPGGTLGNIRSLGDSLTDEECDDYCEDLFTHLDTTSPGRYFSTTVEGSDFHYELWSAGIVPMRFYKGRVAKNLYYNLVNGDLTPYLHRIIDSIYAWEPLDSMVWRVGTVDEAKSWHDFAPQGAVSAVLDDAIQQNNKPWQIWSNSFQDLQAQRLMTGDLDSVNRKIIQMVSPQPYGSSPMPIYYANPDSIDASIYDLFYPDVHENSLADYSDYTNTIQERFGTFQERLEDSFSFTGMKGMARAVDEARFRYRHFALSHPVYQNIQVHGYFLQDSGYLSKETGQYLGWHSNGNPPTPEHIIADTWLAMNCGSDGVIFSDFTYDGGLFGPLHYNWYVETDSNGNYEIDRFLDEMTEYDTLQNPLQSGDHWRIPKMWVGFRSRFNAIRTVMDDLHTIDSVVGWQNLLFLQEQLSLHDTGQSLSTIPGLDTVFVRQAQRYTYDSTGQFLDSVAIDPRASSFLEITHFRPGAGDSTQSPGSRYLLISNRRTWPVDTACHGYNGLGECVDRGLGNIDVRRPIVVLNNITEVFGDSVLIQRVDTTWTGVYAYGDTIELNWLPPGQGALYRVTPHHTVSTTATAYNNAVHSENPSDDDTDRDRLVVYERDSVVYLRTVDPNGVWSKELMISDPDDTVLVSGKRTASNFFPSIALLRDSSTFPRIVWERDSLGYRSVMTAHVSGTGPVTRSTIDSTLDDEYTVERYRLSVADSLDGPPALTPSIVEASTNDPDTYDDGRGFVVSWADHVQGVNVLAVRELLTSSIVKTTDTAGLYRLHSDLFVDDIGQYPTLASIRKLVFINLLAASVAGTPAPDSATATPPTSVPEPPADWRMLTEVHLAWQQGDGVDGDDEHIHYNRLGIRFYDDIANQPTIWADDTPEHVCTNLRACTFEHPSIAVDSVRVGVSFEVFGFNAGNRRHVALRFRDTVGIDPTTAQPYQEWETYLYLWGRQYNKFYGKVMGGDRYVRPSLTQFPLVDSTSLTLQPEGGLTWFWENDPSGARYPQFLYRYGWFSPREIGNGAHPSLTLVPMRTETPFEETSILHRGDSATRVAGENDEGDDVWYYSGHLINTPGNPMPAIFSTGPATSGIIPNIGVTRATTHDSPCTVQLREPILDFGLFFDHTSTPHPDDDRHPPGDPSPVSTTPGLPPTFFERPERGATILDSIDGAERVTRTSIFIANDEAVVIERLASSADTISNWLDLQPWDTERSTGADVWSVVELVRASDLSVLWRGDTISARYLDTNDLSPMHTTLSVPVDQWADSGEIVFIQIRGFASAGVPYELSGGFSFFQEIVGGGGAKQAVRQELERTGDADASLSLQVVPNPVDQGRATLHVTSRLTGRIEVSVWDTRGQRVGTLPSVEADRAGTYSVELDLDGIVPGAYLVRAVSGDVVVSERVTVVR